MGCCLTLTLPACCVAAAAPRDSALRDELLRREQLDQDARRQWMKDIKNPQAIARMGEIDRENTARMKEIVQAHGWPSRALVGKEGVQAAFLLVQHADASPDFQKQCLPLLRRAASQGEVPKEAVAMLTDRVLLHDGKKQLYGTQFIQNSAGEWVPQPIEDEPHVDARRKSMGLPPLADYAKQLREFYGSSAKPKAAPEGPPGKP